MRVDIVIYDKDVLAGIDKLERDFPNVVLAIKKEFGAEAVIQGKQFFVPIDKGNLVTTLRVDVRGNKVFFVAGGIVGKGNPSVMVDYACVFDAHTCVKTINGYKTIGQIKVDDLVLTQTGDYKPVIKKTSFYAKKKPSMVDIIFDYRKGDVHKITVTKDHKILIFRNGRNKWVEANDLLLSDKVYTLIKVDHKKGTRKKKVCIVCGKIYQKQGKNYCSVICRNKHWIGKYHPNYGNKWSVELRKKMSERMKLFHFLHPEKHPNNIMNRKGYQTNIEKNVESWLKQRNINYVKQYIIGRFFLDFYLPDFNEVIEVDGAYWHRKQSKDIKRDKAILSINPELKIIHIHFYEERFTPKKIIIKPLDNVRYIVCNPDINSYIDLDVFKPVRVRKLNRWSYKKGKAKLYDLSVKDIHSFYANGLIISNSYVNYGTSKQPAQFFMEKSVASASLDVESFSHQILRSWLNNIS